MVELFFTYDVQNDQKYDQNDRK